MSKYRICINDLSKGQLAVLIALHHVEPATPELIAVTCARDPKSIREPLLGLYRRGFVVREKPDDRFFRRVSGTKPWIYRLPPTGARLALHLAEADAILQTEQRNDTCANHRPTGMRPAIGKADPSAPATAQETQRLGKEF